MFKSTVINSIASGDARELLSLADLYRRHQFCILGSGWRRVYHGMDVDGFEGKKYVDTSFRYDDARRQIPDEHLGRHDRLMKLAASWVPGYVPIDWQIDVRSGFRFSEGVHHSVLTYGTVDGADAKSSAELGRCRHLITLAIASHLPNGRKYARELKAQMCDWIASNPYGYGAGWRASMNVAIRAASWIFALDIAGLLPFTDSGDVFAEAVRDSLREHASFVAHHLEDPMRSVHPNHYVGEICGLLVVTAPTRGTDPESRHLYTRALEGVREAFAQQVNEEGTDFEGASSYHCFVTEMFVYSMICAATADGAKGQGAVRAWMEANVGRGTVNRIGKMIQVVAALTQPNGLIPLIGDNDSGRFANLEISRPSARDWTSLLAVGSVLVGGGGATTNEYTASQRFAAEVLFGPGCLLYLPTAGRHSVSLPQAGYYIMRDDELFLLVVCGPIGTNGKGGHSHNDKLSFVLSLGRSEIFVDPGIYVYTASKHYYDHYRSVQSHNTLSVAQHEQNRRLEGSPWWGYHDDTSCHCIEWESGPEVERFTGEHRGYVRFSDGGVHQRSIVWKKKTRTLQVIDSLIRPTDNAPPPRMFTTFVLGPDCSVRSVTPQRATLSAGDYDIDVSAENGTLTTQPALFSPEYGTKIATRRLLADCTGAPKSTVTISYRRMRVSS